MSNNTILRVLVWESLPPDRPGITSADVLGRVRAGGHNIQLSTLHGVFSDLRTLCALRSNSQVPRRYWRGTAAATEVAQGQDGRVLWDDAMLAELHRLFAIQPPLSAVKLGEILGVTKSAILSKCHKEGLFRRHNPPSNPAEPLAPRPSGREALPAGHPETWPVIAAHTPSIRADWPV